MTSCCANNPNRAVRRCMAGHRDTVTILGPFQDRRVFGEAQKHVEYAYP